MFWTPFDIILVAFVIVLVFIVAAIMADSENETWVDRMRRHKT